MATEIGAKRTKTSEKLRYGKINWWSMTLNELRVAPLLNGLSYGGTNWESMTLNELRVACKDRGLTDLGTKAELQFRFQQFLGYEHMTHDELKAICVQEGLPFSGSKTELLHTLIYYEDSDTSDFSDDEDTFQFFPTQQPNNRKLTTGPTYKSLITAAIVGLAERTGSSQPAIEKFIMANYPELSYKRFMLRTTLKRNVKSGYLTQVKASYKLSAATKDALKKAAKKTEKAAKAATTKKPATKKVAPKKKATSAKKPAAKKTAARKKPAAKKTAPKKKPAAKKTAPKKKAAAKKSTPDSSEFSDVLGSSNVAEQTEEWSKLVPPVLSDFGWKSVCSPLLSDDSWESL